MGKPISRILVSVPDPVSDLHVVVLMQHDVIYNSNYLPTLASNLAKHQNPSLEPLNSSSITV